MIYFIMFGHEKLGKRISCKIISENKRKIDSYAKPVCWYKKNGNTPVEDKGWSWKANKTVSKEDDCDDNQWTHSGGFNNIKEIFNIGVSPHPFIEIKEIKNDKLDPDNEGKHSLEKEHALFWNLKVESEQISTIPRSRKQ